MSPLPPPRTAWRWNAASRHRMRGCLSHVEPVVLRPAERPRPGTRRGLQRAVLGPDRRARAGHRNPGLGADGTAQAQRAPGLWISEGPVPRRVAGRPGLAARRRPARGGGDRRRRPAGGGREVSEALWLRRGRLGFVPSLARGALSIVTVGMGVSLGREAGPQLAGAATASRLADWADLPLWQRRLLVAAGAGSGFAAVYNVPLGGTLLALEVMLGSLA